MISFVFVRFRRADRHNWRISTRVRRPCEVRERKGDWGSRWPQTDDAHESHDRCATLRVELKRVRAGRPQADACNGRARTSPCYLSARETFHSNLRLQTRCHYQYVVNKMIPLDIQEISVKRIARNVNCRSVFPTIVATIVDRVAVITKTKRVSRDRYFQIEN